MTLEVQLLSFYEDCGSIGGRI